MMQNDQTIDASKSGRDKCNMQNLNATVPYASATPLLQVEALDWHTS